MIEGLKLHRFGWVNSPIDSQAIPIPAFMYIRSVGRTDVFGGAKSRLAARLLKGLVMTDISPKCRKPIPVDERTRESGNYPWLNYALATDTTASWVQYL